MTSPKPDSPLDPLAIRRDFPILGRTVNGKPLVYLDNSATSQKPRQVIDAISSYYENSNANVHRGVHSLSVEATDLYEAARAKVARFINAPSPEQIIWTRNTTEAINLVSHSWAKANLRPGDEILATRLEHHSNMVPWQEVARETGASLRYIEMADDFTLDLSDLDQLLNPKTKLLALTMMSNVLGTITPAKELVAAAHRVGAIVLLDGAQSVPHLSVDAQDLDCDFLVFSAHKMLGPTGIGVLYARESLLEEMAPFLTGGEMVKEVTLERASWNDLPMRFEAGTPNIADAIGFGAAIDYLSALGMDNVREHELSMTCYALERFKELEEVVVYGPTDLAQRGGVASFYASDIHPHDVGTILDQMGIAIRAGHHCAMPLMQRMQVPATGRASFYIYNTEEEIDLLIEGLNETLRFFGNAPRA
jgi:cysteine desulfurase/selenocysteine lyase